VHVGAPERLGGKLGWVSAASDVVVPTFLTLTTLSPDQLAVGAAGSVTLSGSGFATGATILLGGPSSNVTASKITVNGAGTSMTATITAPASAPVGTYSVLVIDPDLLTALCQSCLSVIAPPTLTSLNPSSLARGSKKVPVMLTGTGFATGAKLKGPTGVTFATVVVVDATTITAKATVSSTAKIGTSQGRHRDQRRRRRLRHGHRQTSHDHSLRRQSRQNTKTSVEAEKPVAVLD
jgi:hypothetical protein